MYLAHRSPFLDSGFKTSRWVMHESIGLPDGRLEIYPPLAKAWTLATHIKHSAYLVCKYPVRRNRGQSPNSLIRMVAAKISSRFNSLAPK